MAYACMRKCGFNSNEIITSIVRVVLGISVNTFTHTHLHGYTNHTCVSGNTLYHRCVCMVRACREYNTQEAVIHMYTALYILCYCSDIECTVCGMQHSQQTHAHW